MSIKELKPFTRNSIRDLPIPKEGRQDYKDPNTTGLRLRVTFKGLKTFSYRGKLNGRDKRITIGEFGVITAKDAQTEAARLRALMSEGIDPTNEKRSRKQASTTLAECLEDYLTVKTNQLAPRTKKQYRSEINTHLKGWLAHPLNSINRSDITTKHRNLSKKSPALANRVMRVLRALYNFAKQEYEDKNGKPLFTDNPVEKLSHQKLWNKIERRSGVLKPHQLKPWLNAVNKLSSQTDYGSTLRDYLILILFTGLRRSEAAGLKWANVDFKSKTLFVPITKNRKSHTLPLSDYLLQLLKARKKTKVNDYVFPARQQKGHKKAKRSDPTTPNKGHLTTPTKAIQTVRELSNIEFTLHDLRRTFITIAESLDISPYAVKRLVNHSTESDVTAGYIVWDVERIREPMQRITDYITKAAGIENNDNVVKLPKRKTK